MNQYRSDTKVTIREIEPSKMRKIIAQTVTEVFTTVPHYYVTVPIDATKIIRLCEKENVKIPDVLIKATSTLLKKYENLNGYWENGKIYLYDEVNIGYIVVVDDGMLIPVIKNADKLSIKEIHNIRTDLVKRTLSHRLLPDEYKFGTFTISNLGTLPVESFTGVLYKKQSGLMTVGKVMNGILKVTLVCDHRLVDGYLAARFLSDLKEMLEG